MKINVTLLLLFVLVITACTSRPSSGSAAHALMGTPLLGIAADSNLKVLDLEPQSPAELAGIQRGDILLDIMWIGVDSAKAEAALATPYAISDAREASPLATPISQSDLAVAEGVAVAAIIIITPRSLPESPIPFTEKEQIQSLLRYGDIVLIRVDRNGKILEFTLQPDVLTGRKVGDPTPTPFYTGYYY